MDQVTYTRIQEPSKMGHASTATPIKTSTNPRRPAMFRIVDTWNGAVVRDGIEEEELATEIWTDNYTDDLRTRKGRVGAMKLGYSEYTIQEYDPKEESHE